MSDFFKTVKEFAHELLCDAPLYPSAVAAWPRFRQSVAELCRDAKSDLFFFRRDTLDPIVSGLTEKTDAILKLGDASAKADQLLALKDEVQEKMSPLHKRSETAVVRYASLSIVVMAALAMPLGAGAAFVGVLVCDVLIGKFALNRYAVYHRDSVIGGKIGREILNMAAGDARNGLFNSPKFQQALIDKGVLKRAFAGADRGNATDKDYEKMAARVAKSRRPGASA